MPRRILILQGHPDPDPTHFGHALATAYAQGATEGGHAVQTLRLATLEFPLLRTKEDWDHGPLPASLVEARDAIDRADHLVLLFPLWLGTMPALVKGFLEQVLRPAPVPMGNKATLPTKILAGKSARVVVTMGMPAFWYRWYFRAHGVRGLERNILRFCGARPVRDTLIGWVEGSTRSRQRRLIELHRLGRAGR